MAFLDGLLSCCAPSKKRLEAEAETRRARIVSIYNDSYNRSLSNVGQNGAPLPPPKYSDISHDETLMVAVDEKTTEIAVIRDESAVAEPQRYSSPAPTFSDRSSVVSIPSTRFSGITSTYTGNTVRIRLRIGATGDSNRSSWRDSGIYSDFHSSAPPSYYAGSDSDVESESQEPHPVMADGWLERLRQQAEARLDQQDRHGD